MILLHLSLETNVLCVQMKDYFPKEVMHINNLYYHKESFFLLRVRMWLFILPVFVSSTVMYDLQFCIHTDHQH